jgi:hypothetical protein
VLAVLGVLPSGEARAVGAVGLQTWGTGIVDENIDPGESITATGSGLAASMANNPGLNGSAWAHTGAWWSIHFSDATEVRIRVQASDPAQLAPGLSVWAVGNSAPFDGGTTGFGSETSTAGFGTPHSFNAFSVLGSPGTLWMQNGQGGNAKELVGYAIAGPSYSGSAGWGETITNGAHDMSSSDVYVTTVSGSVGAGFAELVLQGVPAGWFLVYVGGTDVSLAGGAFTLSAVSVPEPGTGLMRAVGAALLAWKARRR